MLVLLADTFTITVTVTTITGSVVLLSRSTGCTGAPFLVACLLATELFGTITSFLSPYLELTEPFGQSQSYVTTDGFVGQSVLV
jgi:hypothetical protein